jgi:hypothetical protein
VRVWILQEEWNERGEGPDPVLGVYASEELAEAARTAAVAAAKNEGRSVWAEDESDEDDPDWDVDYHVFDFDLIDDAAAAAKP